MMEPTLLDDFPCGCELWEVEGKYGVPEPDWRPCEEHQSRAEIELAQLKEDCAPFVAQIEQRKTYQIKEGNLDEPR